MVLVAGGSTNDAQWEATANLAAWAYQTALARRLGKPALRYLSAGPAQDLDGDGTNDVAAAATLSNLAEAITIWPTNANRLTVYLLGSSTTNGQCRLNATESLTASQLDGWLDTFQATNTAALVVMDFDGCGGYVPALSPPPGAGADRDRQRQGGRRAAVRARRADQLLAVLPERHLQRQERGGGLRLRAGRDQVRQRAGCGRPPQLDDNGNGVPDQKNIDGLLAAQRYLGAAFATGADAPFIGAVTPDRARGRRRAGDPLGRSRPGRRGHLQRLVRDHPAGLRRHRRPAADQPGVERRHRPLRGPLSNFTLPGTYACTFFALDNDGQLSAPVQSLVTATDAYEPDDTPAPGHDLPDRARPSRTTSMPPATRTGCCSTRRRASSSRSRPPSWAPTATWCWISTTSCPTAI